MSQSSSLISANIKTASPHKYLYTSMVSHRGTPVSLAMRQDGRIFYSVLDMSNTEKNASKTGDQDKNYWSEVNFKDKKPSQLHFPSEIMQVGYGVVPNRKLTPKDTTDDKNTARFG